MANRLPRYREQGVRTGRRLPGTGRLLLRTTVRGEEVFYGTWYAGGRRLKRRIGAKRGRNERSGGLTTNQAEDQLRRMIAATAARPRVDDRLNITELGTLYIANARRRGRKRSTLLNVESYVRVHFQPFFRDRPVETIEPADVIRLMGKLEQAGKTPKTIRNILATLSALFNFAIAPHRRFAAFNPCAGIELPAAPEPEEIRFLTLDQVDLLLDHIRPGILAHIDKPLLLAAVMTGMRKGELVALRWRDVDFTAARIRVRRNYTCGEFGTPKTRRSTRSIPLAPELADALIVLRSVSRWTRPDDLVFAHPDHGGVLPKANISRRFTAALRAAGIDEHHRFHDLRHTFGTRMAASNVPMRTLQEWMGHRHLTTTERYADYCPSAHEGEMLAAAFERGRGEAPPPLPAAAVRQAGQPRLVLVGSD